MDHKDVVGWKAFLVEGQSVELPSFVVKATLEGLIQLFGDALFVVLAHENLRENVVGRVGGRDERIFVDPEGDGWENKIWSL